MRCPSCGTYYLENEPVCQSCGALLSVTAEELERVERYRLNANTELLCVMFADVSGFSGIANRSLSLSQHILAVHMALSQAVIERDRAGEVVNTAGDGILAVFSNPATATERALELHAAIHHYHAGQLSDGYLADALRAAKLPLRPNPDDEAYQIHIGLHLGLVTRGGRTSRDVFGHNVNIACRLCSMADQGQTYMSEAVYDNARLILGGREDLEWRVWKEQAIRGLSEPMDIVGVGQQPYHAVTPPRGAKLPEPPKTAALTRAPVLSALVLAVVAASVLLISHLWPHPPPPTPRPPPPPKPVDILRVRLPVYAGTDMVKLDAPLPAPPLLPPPDSLANPAHAGSSAENRETTGKSAPPADTPPATGELSAEEPPFTDAADLEHFKPDSLRLDKATATNFGEMPASLLVFTGKDALVIAVTVKEPLHATTEVKEQVSPAGEVKAPKNTGALMSLYLDGDLDDVFDSKAPDFLDVLVSIGTPQSDAARPRLQKLRDGRPGADFADLRDFSARVFSRENSTLWLFRLPLHQLHLSPIRDAQFRLEYAPEGPEKPTVCSPGATGFGVFEIPRGDSDK